MEPSHTAVLIALFGIAAALYLSISQESSSTVFFPPYSVESDIVGSTNHGPHKTGIAQQPSVDENPNVKTALSNNKLRKWKLDKSKDLQLLISQTRQQCDIPTVSKDASINDLQIMMDRNIPFVVKGYSDDWPAKEVWTKQYLTEKFGDRVIKQDSETSIVHNSGGVSQGITFEKYIDALEGVTSDPKQNGGNSQSDLFVFDTEILHAIPELQNDVHIPQFVRYWDNEENEANKSMWHMLSIGPSRSGLPLHSHGKTWISVVHGSKKWFLYPPGFNVPDSVGQGCHALCTVSHWLKHFYPKLLHLPHVYDVSNTAKKNIADGNAFTINNYVDVFREIYEYKHPSWTVHSDEEESFKPLECIQEAGDLVYLPDQWLHLTFNIGETIGFGGQSALMAQHRLDLARENLLASPDDFNLLRDYALGTSHLLIDHNREVRSYGQYFDQTLKVLVFSTAALMRSFADLTEDPVVVIEFSSKDVNEHQHVKSVTRPGKAILAIINAIVYSEAMHRFDTIVILPDRSSLSRKGGSSLSFLHTQNIDTEQIHIYLHHAHQKSTKICILDGGFNGNEFDVDYILSCLVANLQKLSDELNVADASVLGDEKGGSSKFTRESYVLVKNILRRALEKRPSSLEAWRLLAEVSGMVGDYANMENAIVDANNIYDKIIAKSVEDGIMVSRKAAAAIYHQLATSFMAVELGKPALPLLEKTLNLSPEYGPAWIDRIVAAGMARNRTLANEKLLELKQRYPKHPAIPQLVKYVKSLGLPRK